jgi:hypothetical protein
MNAASICQFINGGVVGRGLSSRKVSLAMTKLGFKRVRTNQGAFYEVYQIPPNEIQPTLAITDNETVDSQADTSWHEQPLPF